MIRPILTGTAALISFFVMMLCIMNFFSAMSLGSGALMVGTWLLTIGLCYLASKSQTRSSGGCCKQ